MPFGSAVQFQIVMSPAGNHGRAPADHHRLCSKLFAERGRLAWCTSCAVLSRRRPGSLLVSLRGFALERLLPLTSPFLHIIHSLRLNFPGSFVYIALHFFR